MWKIVKNYELSPLKRWYKGLGIKFKIYTVIGRNVFYQTLNVITYYFKSLNSITNGVAVKMLLSEDYWKIKRNEFPVFIYLKNLKFISYPSLGVYKYLQRKKDIYIWSVFFLC